MGVDSNGFKNTDNREFALFIRECERERQAIQLFCYNWPTCAIVGDYYTNSFVGGHRTRSRLICTDPLLSIVGLCSMFPIIFFLLIL